MRKITVEDVEFMNGNLHNRDFQSMKSDSKALFLTLFLLNRKDNKFSLYELRILTFDLGYKKRDLENLFDNGFFIEFPDGTLSLTDYNNFSGGVV